MVSATGHCPFDWNIEEINHRVTENDIETWRIYADFYHGRVQD